MANPGAKFVSVNLNKSYGNSSSSSSHHSNQGAPGRGRGAGMVLLSRSRVPQKPAAPKLSVPPPLNLPSLRKEHQKSDSSGSGGGAAAGAGTGAGPRPSSSGMGWTKPAPVSQQDKDTGDGESQVQVSARGVDAHARIATAYMPPSARPAAAFGARPLLKPVERAVVLKGEDFPSLQAALPVSSGPGQKPKDTVTNKQKPAISEEFDQKQGGFQSNSRLDARSHVQDSRNTSVNGSMDDAGDSRGSGSYHMSSQIRKEDFFSSPLPMVRLNPRSDWADDERDTGFGIVERNRDTGFVKIDSYWERDFDMPRISVLPYKSQYDRRGLRDDDTGRNFSSDVSKVDPYHRVVRMPSREGKEGNMWRSSPSFKDVQNGQEVTNDRTGVGARNFNKGFGNENRYAPAQDSRNAGNVWDAKPQWNSSNDLNFTSRGAERISQDRYGLQNSSFTKPSFPSASDSFLASGRDNRGPVKTERQFFEDPFMGSSGFDDKDPFSGGLVGVIKRRKDVVKQTELRDPVRESFEAELERVQKMQELERRRAVEEQERALEQARREEEERQRLIREEEERLQRLEDETREASWRAEQERLESLRKAEELRVSREEEKRRMQLEDERRKQAAKQKLIELEEKMAKRQVEGTKPDSSVATLNTDEKLASMQKDKDVSTTSTDLETWEDSERMVERLTTSSSVDSSGPSRSFETDSRSFSTSSATFLDRGKQFNSWRRDAFEGGSSASSQMQGHEFNHFSPQRDSFAGMRAVGRKEFHGGAGYTSRVNTRGMQEPYFDEFGHQREQRWNFPGDVDAFSGGRDIDAEFRDNFPERYGNVGWAQNHFRGNTHSPYPERPYMNTESDDLYPYGRPRYSMRQPRVLPPPIASIQRTSFRAGNERPGPSGLRLDNEHGSRAERIEPTRPTGYYSDLRDGVEHSALVDRPESATVEDQRLNNDCDSQSSVSVSSPPSSPPHLSHDELDDSGDSPTLTSTGVGKHISQTGNETVILYDNSGHHTAMTASGSISATEEEDWAVEHNADLQQQEEYDEDEDAYQEEDEVREGDDENLDLKQDFGDLHLEDKDSSHMMDNLVLAFDEGIEVELPNDDVGITGSSMQYVRERGLGDDAQGDEHHHELGGSFPSGTTAVQEAEKAIQDSVVTPISDPYPSILEGPSLSFQPTSSSPPAGAQSSTASISSSTNQIDTPVKLQFGLFSGPSLIPSPVAAIQIGSIQMPLHPYHHIGSSITHPSQPPLFQFGQVRYSSPISQGILPIAPPSMSFVQPTALAPHGLNQNAGGLLPNKLSESTNSQKAVNGDSSSLTMNNKPGSALVGPSGTPRNSSVPVSSDLVRQRPDSTSQTQTTAVKVPSISDDRTKPEAAGQAENRWHNNSFSRNRGSGRGRQSGNQSQNVMVSSESTSSERIYGGMRAQGAIMRGKRFAYAVKNNGTRFDLPVVNEPYQETNGFQRRSRKAVHRAEFRVRENADRRPQSGSFSNSSLNVDDKPNYNGRYGTQFARSGSKRGILSSKPVKQIAADSEGSISGNISQDVKSDNLTRKELDIDVSIKDQSLPRAGEGNMMKNILEEEFDAPLQSGIVRIFKQPGIEVPSDEDDFIQVRSKRQMLNDRREQKEKERLKEKEKEKEMKANFRAPPRRLRSSRQVVGGSINFRKNYASVHGGSSPYINSNFSSSEGQVYKEASSVPVSQPLAPIGTPAIKLEQQTDKRSQSVKSVPTSSGGGKDGPDIMFESKDKAMDNVQSSSSTWDNVQLNQQVMTLTQTQLEEAMKTPRFGSPISSVGGHGSSVTEPLLPSSSLLGKELSFPTSSSPISSLLAGEKIQFGAVTSPSILPPSSRAPGSSRPDVQIPNNLPVAEDDGELNFKKDKLSEETCTRVQDSKAESEAEAAASAVAVAAIASEEVVRNGPAISESKSFAIGHGISTEMSCDQQLAFQSRAEESLSVSLPADLSVETPPISSWPPLPSPQGSSNQMISHFPGGPPPSPFPFYEMNPMLGGPIFAFGPSEESAGSQSQAQKNVTASSSGPMGTWQQCHSSMDSFYGHPAAGYTGPFIAPPGVHSPPHMVVYNHFAPVGQFGQVGLSFMGPTYIPSGKHSDWKHSPSSSVGMTEGHKNSSIIATGPGQRNHPNMAAPIQHLASGSPVIPIAPPLAMYDASPFQSAPDMSVQAHWSHVASPHSHSVPLPRPMQQGEEILPSPSGPTGPVDQSLNVNKSQSTSTALSEVNAAEVGLVDSSRAITTCTTNPSASADAPVGGNNNEGLGTRGGSRMRSRNYSSNHNNNYQRGGRGASQRNNEWSHRRGGGYHHGRNQSAPVKVKQVYVAKQQPSSSTTPASG